MAIYWDGKYHKNCKATHPKTFDIFIWEQNGRRCPFCNEPVELDDLEDDN